MTAALAPIVPRRFADDAGLRNYPDGPPKPWCVEHELAVPEFWRDPDKVEAEDE